MLPSHVSLLPANKLQRFGITAACSTLPHSTMKATGSGMAFELLESARDRMWTQPVKPDPKRWEI
jgi:hypothetical protein